MQLHVVCKEVGGYAREDSPIASVVGAYTSQPLAAAVAMLSSGARVQTVELNAVPPGLVALAKEMDIQLPSA